MTKRRSPGAERLFKARHAAAKELKLPVDDWRVKRYAVLMCAYDGVQARLASGADINVDILLKLDAAMQEIRTSAPQELLKVEIEYCGTLDFCPSCKGRVPDHLTNITACPHCGWRPSAVAAPTPPAPEPRTDAVPKPDKRSSVPASKQDNVVPLRSSQHP